MSVSRLNLSSPRLKKKPGSASEKSPYSIQLRLFVSEPKPHVFRTIHRVCEDRRDYPMVAKWNYVVSKRLRLTAGPVGAGIDDLQSLVATYLKDDPEEATEDFIRDLARADVIEISIPYTTENIGWAARLFPWENALSIITRRYRQRALAVVRHLDLGRTQPATPPGNPPRVLVVRSTPGELAKSYDFRSESALVSFKLGSTGAAFADLDSPTVEQLEQHVAARKPDVVHLAVIDTHGLSIWKPELVEAAWNREMSVEQRREGIVLSGGAAPYRALSAAEAADVVTARGAHGAALVSFATCFSATRLAPLAVAGGARAAIGFHEALTDGVSEAFFAALYGTWREGGWDLLAAFQAALGILRGQPESGRCGVSLWSNQSLVTGREQRMSRDSEEKQPAKRSRPRAISELDGVSVREVFTVACSPLVKVNYCSLHNGRDLFTEFSIKKNTAGLTPPVEVRVELTAENESAAWRQSLAFGEAPGSESLAKRVRVPLGARALRRVQESTRSSLFVEVKCGAHVLLQQSSQVTLLPVDEWRDTDDDRRWLPSFVLPRDPAVRQIMAAADRYLRALCDDSGAGFDGYQQAAEWPDVVDLQARAIWCALLYDFRLRYINPPPTYTKTEQGIAQRLRTPTQILEEGRGTCIDLALLFASCLEYVGIYPVIYLISGHAFPGWWRNEDAYQAFAGFSYLNLAPQANGSATAQMIAAEPVSRDEFAQWMVTGRDGFGELVTPLREGSLAALESTLLCTSGAFEEALQQGRDNLADAEIFDALINVQRAREGDDPVTPLPIVGGHFPGAKPLGANGVVSHP